MKLRYSLLFVVIFCSTLLSAQSIDEEEPVHLGEGSGNSISDDEDIEGSSLPPDTHYATTPHVHPKFSSQRPIEDHSEETTKKGTTIMRTQKITKYATSTPRINTRPTIDGSSATGADFSNNFILIALAIVLLILFGIIITILCCRSCKNRKQAYRPGIERRSDALLSSSPSR